VLAASVLLLRQMMRADAAVSVMRVVVAVLWACELPRVGDVNCVEDARKVDRGSIRGHCACARAKH